MSPPTKRELRELLRHPSGQVQSHADWYAEYSGLRNQRPMIAPNPEGAARHLDCLRLLLTGRCERMQTMDFLRPL